MLSNVYNQLPDAAVPTTPTW